MLSRSMTAFLFGSGSRLDGRNMQDEITQQPHTAPTPKTPIYTPPSFDEIDAYTQQVCDTLPDGLKPSSRTEFVCGFSSFLTTVTSITAKHLTERRYRRTKYGGRYYV
jgi:hypothetical protein